MATWIATDKYIVVKRKRDRYFRSRYVRLMLHNDRAHKEETIHGGVPPPMICCAFLARRGINWNGARRLYTSGTTSPWHIELSLLLDTSITNFLAARPYPFTRNPS